MTECAYVTFAVSLVLLPIRSFTLPLNTELVDLWNFAAVPLFWLYLISTGSPIRAPYAVPMWLIVVTSLVATWGAESPSTALTVLLKELYLYAWFVTAALMLARFAPDLTRRVLVVWSVVAAVHAALVLAQFFSPTILNATAFSDGETVYRPPGLFKNSNGTALYQVMAFVPLFLARLGRARTAVLGTLYVLAVVATGSMSGFAAIVVGAGVIVSMSLLVARPARDEKRNPTTAIVLVLFATVVGVFFLQNPENQERLEYLFYGRAERSGSSRVILWAQAKELIQTDAPLWGIGPNNFSDSQFGGQSLHNDMIAFTVERGLLGALGLALFVGMVLVKSAAALFRRRRDRVAARDAVVLFAAISALLVPSLTHQIFHARSVWMVLALQEVFLARPAHARRRTRDDVSSAETMGMSSQRAL